MLEIGPGKHPFLPHYWSCQGGSSSKLVPVGTSVGDGARRWGSLSSSSESKYWSPNIDVGESWPSQLAHPAVGTSEVEKQERGRIHRLLIYSNFRPPVNVAQSMSWIEINLFYSSSALSGVDGKVGGKWKKKKGQKFPFYVSRRRNIEGEIGLGQGDDNHFIFDMLSLRWL